MKLERFFLLAVTPVTLLIIGAPETALATTRVVNPSAFTCDSTSTTSPCYRSIGDALTAAADNDTIEIHPGTYTGTITLTKKLTLTGTETARTILSGGGSGPIITIDALTSVTIRRLSFTSATTGLLIKNSSSVRITNCVFRVGTSGTGIDVQTSSSATIENNTFYQNQYAVAFTSGTSVSIINNIFSSNTNTAVYTVGGTATSFQYNCFFSNTLNGATGDTTNNVTTDPVFVDTVQGDFHLQTTTSCKNNGDSSVGSDSIDQSLPDLGAYGGPLADTIPFPVENFAAQDISSPPAYAVRLTWDANTCYQIAGYNIHYGTASGSYTTTTNALNVITYDVTGLTPASAPLGAPVLSNGISNATLPLTWDTAGVAGATGYEVRYSDTTTPPVAPVIDAGNTTSYSLSGLTNGTWYYVSVTPYARAVYYFTVTAYYTNTTAFESAYSDEENLPIGSTAYGTSSNIIHDFPEPIISNPDLPNKGCFIATAAYGYYSAPQVQALREFRDRYLTTNAAGRAFVRWYYQHGPVGAQFINEHPWLKPVVRTALMPAVGGAMFMTRTSMFTKIIVFMFVGLLTIIRLRTLQKKGDAS